MNPGGIFLLLNKEHDMIARAVAKKAIHYLDTKSTRTTRLEMSSNE